MITVIVPCYNVENYIIDCVRSLIKQSIPFDEIILIDDCSQDKTYDIIKHEFAFYDNIKIFQNQRNLGLSKTRNIGSLKAKGEYICFVDADDILSSTYVKTFNENISIDPQIDMLCFSIKNFFTTGEENLSGYFYYNTYKNNGKRALIDLINTKNFYSCSVGYIFKKNLINWNIDGFKHIIHEDEEFTPRLFLSSNLCLIISENLYFRRIRPNSITTSKLKLANLKGYFFCFISNLKLLFSSLKSKKLFICLLNRQWYFFKLIINRTLVLIRNSVIYNN